MDFHSLKRKQLQALCKTHGIPANLKNVEMADRLSSLLKEKEGCDTAQERSVEKEGLSGLSFKHPVTRNAKKVKFSPEEDEVFEYEPTVRRDSRWDRRQSRRQSVVKFGSELSVTVSPQLGGDVARKGRLLKRNAVEENGGVVEVNGNVRKSRRKSVVKSASENPSVVLPTRGGKKKVTDVIEEIEEGVGRDGRLRRVSKRTVVEDDGSSKQNGEVVEEETNVRKSRRQSTMKSAIDEPTVLSPLPGRRKKATKVIEEAKDGAGHEGPLLRGSKRNVSVNDEQALEEEINVRKSRRQAVRKSVSDELTILLPQPGRRKRATESIEETRNAADPKEIVRRLEKPNAARDGGDSKQSGHVPQEETNMRKSRRQSAKSASDKPTILLPQPGRRKRARESSEETGNAVRLKERIQRPSKRNFVKDNESLNQNGKVLEGDANVGENSVRKSRSIAHRQGITSNIGNITRKEKKHEAIVEVEASSLEPMFDAHSGIVEDTVQIKECNGPTELEEEGKPDFNESISKKQPSATVIVESAVIEPRKLNLDSVLNSSKENEEQSNKKEESGIASPGIDQQTLGEVPSVCSDVKQFVSATKDLEISVSEQYGIPSHLGKVYIDVNSTEKLEDISSGSEKDNLLEGAICSNDMDDDNANFSDGQANLGRNDLLGDVLSSVNLLDHAGQLGSPLNYEMEVEDKELLEYACNPLESYHLTRTKQLDLQYNFPSSEDLFKNEAVVSAGSAASEHSELKLTTRDGTNSLEKSLDLCAVDIDVQEAKSNLKTFMETKNYAEIVVKSSVPEFSSDVPPNLEEGNSDMNSSDRKRDDISLISEKDDSQNQVIPSDDSDDDTSTLLGEQDYIIKDAPVADGLSYAGLENSGKLGNSLNLENVSVEKESLVGVGSFCESDDFVNMKQLNLQYEVPSRETLLSNEAPTFNAGFVESELKLDPACDCSNKDVEKSNESRLSSVDMCTDDIVVEEARNMVETPEESSLPVNTHDISSNQKEDLSGNESLVGALKPSISCSDEENMKHSSFDATGIDGLTHNLLNTKGEAYQDDIDANGSLSIDQSSSEGEPENHFDFEKELMVTSEDGHFGSDVIHSAAQVDEINSVLHEDHVRSTSEFEQSYCTNRRDSCAIGTLNQESNQSKDQENNLANNLGSCQRDNISNKETTATFDHTFSSGGVFVSNAYNRVCSEMVTSEAIVSATEAMRSANNNEEELLQDIASVADAKEKFGEESLVDQISPRCDIMLQSVSDGRLHVYGDSPKANDVSEDSPVTLGFLSEVFQLSATTGLEKTKGLQPVTADVSSPALETCEPSLVLQMQDISSKGLCLDSNDIYCESDEEDISKTGNEVHRINVAGDKLFICSEDCEVTSKKSSADTDESNIVCGSVSQSELSCSSEKDLSYSVLALPVSCSSEKDLSYSVLALPEANHDSGQKIYHFQEQFTSKNSSGHPIEQHKVLLEQTCSWDEFAVDHAGALSEAVKDTIKEVIPSECSRESPFISCNLLSEKNNRLEEVMVDRKGASIEKTLSNNEEKGDVLKEAMTSKSSSEGFVWSHEAFLDEINNQVDQGDTSFNRISLNHDEREDVLKEVSPSESSYDDLFRSYEALLEENNNKDEVGLGMSSTEKHWLKNEESETSVKKVMTMESIYKSHVKSCDAQLEATYNQDNVQVGQGEASNEETNDCSIKEHDTFLEDNDIEDGLNEVLTTELSLPSASMEFKGGMASIATDGNRIQEDCESPNFTDCLHYNVENSEERITSKLLVQISDNIVSRLGVDSCRESDAPEKTPISIGKEISTNIAQGGVDTSRMLLVSLPCLIQQPVDSCVVPAMELVSGIDDSCLKKLDSMSTDGKDTDAEETAKMEEENLNIVDEVSEAEETLLTEVTFPVENLVEKPEDEQNTSGSDYVLDPKSVEIAVVSVDAQEKYADDSTSRDNGSEALSTLPLQSDVLKVGNVAREENKAPNTEQVPSNIMKVKSDRTRFLSKTPHKLFNHHDMKENPSNLKSPKFATATKVLSKRQPLGGLPNK